MRGRLERLGLFLHSRRARRALRLSLVLVGVQMVIHGAGAAAFFYQSLGIGFAHGEVFSGRLILWALAFVLLLPVAIYAVLWVLGLTLILLWPRLGDIPPNRLSSDEATPVS